MIRPRTPVRVAVVGERQSSAELERAAVEIGREIARRGGIVVCGGMGGVMEAAARGATEAGGTVVGVIPTESAGDANPYVTIPIVTGMNEGRNIIVVRSAQAVIAVGGAFGTLSEIALALRLGIPVVGYETWTLDKPDHFVDPIIRAASPLEAVELALSAANERL